MAEHGTHDGSAMSDHEHRAGATALRLVKGGIVPGGGLCFHGNQRKILTPMKHHKAPFDKTNAGVSDLLTLLFNALSLLYLTDALLARDGSQTSEMNRSWYSCRRRCTAVREYVDRRPA